jgi:hypothetical protein
LLAGFADFVAGFTLFLFWEFLHDTSSSFVPINIKSLLSRPAVFLPLATGGESQSPATLPGSLSPIDSDLLVSCHQKQKTYDIDWQMMTLWCHSLLGSQCQATTQQSISRARQLWRLCTENSSAATNTFMEACGVV